MEYSLAPPQMFPEEWKAKEAEKEKPDMELGDLPQEQEKKMDIESQLKISQEIQHKYAGKSPSKQRESVPKQNVEETDTEITNEPLKAVQDIQQNVEKLQQTPAGNEQLESELSENSVKQRNYATETEKAGENREHNQQQKKKRGIRNELQMLKDSLGEVLMREVGQDGMLQLSGPRKRQPKGIPGDQFLLEKSYPLSPKNSQENKKTEKKERNDHSKKQVRKREKSC